jgi:hypothetical protein
MVNQYEIDVLLDAATVSKLLIMIRLSGRINLNCTVDQDI